MHLKSSKYNKIPVHLTFSFACLIRFYKGTWQGKELPVKDVPDIVETFRNIWKLDGSHQIVETVLKTEEFWGEDLTKKEHLAEAIVTGLDEIESNGIQQGFTNFKKKY